MLPNMKITLINPPHPHLVKPDSQAPLSLMYLVSILRSYGYEVELLNLSSKTLEESVKLIPTDSDLYGITATSVDYPICEDLVRLFREVKPEAQVILGGAHPTLAPTLVNFAVFTSICMGESELIINDIVRDAINNKLKAVYRGSRLTKNDLEFLPYPARDSIDVLGGPIFAYDKHFGTSISTVIIASRGCPFKCSFCAARKVWSGGMVVRRSPQNVVDEMEHVKARYGVTEFRFSDDMMNNSRKWLREFCEKVSDLNIYWRCSVRAGVNNEEDFKIMYDSGCREVSAGIETGDQRVLDALNKGTTVQDNEELLISASDAGLNVRILLMTGTPGEHPDTPELTRDFLARVPFHFVAQTMFRPLPGSDIWINPNKYGCTILTRDLRLANFYSWIKGPSGNSIKTPIKASISTSIMSIDAMEDNMRRSHEYVMATGKCNQG